MVYLVGVTIVAANFGRYASILASFLSVACFDFFFVEPYFTFTVSDTQYVLTFAVMLFTALVISTLASRLKEQVEAIEMREHNMSALYAMTKELVSSSTIEELVAICASHIASVFASHVTIWVPDSAGQLQLIYPHDTPYDLKEETVVLWAYHHGEKSGLGTLTLPGARGLYLPLIGSEHILGVLGILLGDGIMFESGKLHLLEIFTGQMALALERMRMTNIAEKRKIEAETEKLRSSLLSSVSHDLRTPLATIRGASSSLILNEDKLSAATKKDLLHSIHDEAIRLTKIVSNILDVTRLESAAVCLNKDFYDMDELIGTALQRCEEALAGHTVKTDIETVLPSVYGDGTLIEQVLINLLENAAKYTPQGSIITVEAQAQGATIMVRIKDEGTGIEPGFEEKIFDKFYSIRKNGKTQGTGLGLAICRAIITAHGGAIWSENLREGGACFTFTLPIEALPKEVPHE